MPRLKQNPTMTSLKQKVKNKPDTQKRKPGKQHSLPTKLVATRSHLMKNLSRNLAFILSTLLAPAVFAEQGFYLGLQGGYSDIDSDEDIVELKGDVNGQVYAGYMFTDWIGLELAYTDFGSFEIKDSANKDEIDFSGIHLGLAFEGEFVGNTKVFAKLGLYDIDTELNSTEGSDTGFFYQAGLAFPVAKHMDITVSWQNYHKIEVLDASVNSGIDAYDIGIRFVF